MNKLTMDSVKISYQGSTVKMYRAIDKNGEVVYVGYELDGSDVLEYIAANNKLILPF